MPHISADLEFITMSIIEFAEKSDNAVDWLCSSESLLCQSRYYWEETEWTWEDLQDPANMIASRVPRYIIDELFDILFCIGYREDDIIKNWPAYLDAPEQIAAELVFRILDGPIGQLEFLYPQMLNDVLRETTGKWYITE